MSVSVAQDAGKPAAPGEPNGTSSGIFAMGALRRLGLSLTVSFLVAAAAWWALTG
ncbi:MAG: hypothetical protein ACTSWI_04935 [Alphaproteobacteria bacterium]